MSARAAFRPSAARLTIRAAKPLSAEATDARFGVGDWRMVVGKVSERSSTVSPGGYKPTSLASTVSPRPLGDGLRDRVRGLFTPEAGLLGQWVRYLLGGCTTVAVYLLTTTLLAVVVGLPFEIALAIGFCTMITVNFALHRMFVWMHHEGFALPAHRQFARYIAVAGTQYGLTAVGTAVLPGALGISAEIVYVVMAVSFAAICFLTYRQSVFHAKEPTPVGAAIGIGRDTSPQIAEVPLPVQGQRRCATLP